MYVYIYICHWVRQSFREKLDMAQVTVKIRMGLRPKQDIFKSLIMPREVEAVPWSEYFCRHLGKAVVAGEQMIFKQLYW